MARITPRRLLKTVLITALLVLAYQLGTLKERIFTLDALKSKVSIERDSDSNSSLSDEPILAPITVSTEPLENTMSLELRELVDSVAERKFYPAMVRDTPSLATQLPPNGYSRDFPRNGCWEKEGKLKCIPGLYLAGFPKCGTSDLFVKLAWHPAIRKPGNGEKEHYWWSPGRLDNDLYSYVDKVTPPDMDSTKDAYIMDGSPSLVNGILGWYPERFPQFELPPYTNADILHWAIPTAKVIAAVRNPVERSWSAYFYFNDHPPLSAASFEVDSRKMVEDMNECLEGKSLRYCCAHWREKMWHRRILLQGSIYICYLVDWKLKFGANFYLVNLDEVRDDPMGMYKDIFKWLDLTTDLDFTGLEKSLKKVTTLGVRGKKVKMLDESRLRLEAFFKPFNIILAEFFNNDGFLKWNERSSHSPDLN